MKLDRLTANQTDWLVMVEGAGREGYSAPANQRTLLSLQRRGLVEPKHCRSSLKNRRWVATFAGSEWVRHRDEAPGQRSRWARGWSGESIGG